MVNLLKQQGIRLSKKVDTLKPQDVASIAGRTPARKGKSAATAAMRKAIADIIIEEGLTALFYIDMM